MRFLSVVLALMTIITSQNAFARKVGVVLWVADMTAFNNKSYKIEMDHYRKSHPDLEFETIYLKSYNTKNFEEKVEETLVSLNYWDKVSLLVIATHGKTDQNSNRTILSKVGSFGSDGADGFLKTFLDRLGPNLSPDLQILLESCSTYCGTKDQILKRTKGLYNELAPFGVKNLSVWGATQQMMTSQLDRRTYWSFIKSVSSKAAKVIMPLGIVASIATKDVQPLIMSGAVMASISGLAIAQYATSSTGGYEVKMDEKNQWAVVRDYYDKNLFHEDLRCESVFAN